MGSWPRHVLAHALDDEAGFVAGFGGVRLAVEFGRREVLGARER